MKNARAYMKEICKALTSWEEWLQDGESMIAAGDKQLLLRFIEHQTAQLRRLDAEEVKDDLLQHEDGIGLRLGRLENDYKLLATARHISATKDTPAQTTDAEVNAAIDRCRQVIALKTMEVIRVYDECEQLITPKNPVLEKALSDPLLLNFFYDNKKELEKYILYCQSDANKTQKAIRAKELANDEKIRKDYILKPLHDALEKVGVNVGSYVNWQQAINKL